MAVIDEVVACVVIGIVAVCLGAWMIAKRSVEYIHPNYLKNVSKNNLPALAVSCGCGIVLTGAGFLLLGPALLWYEPSVVVLGSIMLGSGLVLCLFAIVYFNGSFS